MTLLLLFYIALLVILAFAFYKIWFRPSPFDKPKPQQTFCKECGVSVNKAQVQKVVTDWGYSKDEDYYCDRHERLYTLADHKTVTFRYYAWVEIDRMKVYRHENNIPEPEEVLLDTDEQTARTIKKETQKLGKRGLK